MVRAPAEGVDGATEVRVGVRPEKLRVVAVGEDAGVAVDSSLNSLAGTILDASYVGVSTQYLIDTGGGQRLTVYAQNLETSGSRAAIADGQRVRVTWRPEHTFVIGGPHEHHETDPHSLEGEESDE